MKNFIYIIIKILLLNAEQKASPYSLDVWKICKIPYGHTKASYTKEFRLALSSLWVLFAEKYLCLTQAGCISLFESLMVGAGLKNGRHTRHDATDATISKTETFGFLLIVFRLLQLRALYSLFSSRIKKMQTYVQTRWGSRNFKTGNKHFFSWKDVVKS